MDKITLGSLFDGSGGFPLAGLIHGITPLWASEIEPFPIRVTTKRLPQMEHLGDISKLNGADIPPADIITFGSPCTDLSVAGQRAGLDGEKSSLFFEAVRIIKEMRRKTNGKQPRFIVWENVPGAYSSQEGRDFRCVLAEIAKIKDETLNVPMPKDGKWLPAGEIMGTDFSIAFRCLDAQYWGVPQRRRRIFLVADFGGFSAGRILFDSEGLSWNIAARQAERKGTADHAEGGTGTASRIVLNDQGGAMMCVSENITGTLRAEEHGHPPLIVEPDTEEAKSDCLTPWDVQSKRIHDKNGKWPSLYGSAGGGRGYVATDTVAQSAGFCPEHSAKSHGVGFEDEKSPTLRAGTVPGVVAIENHPADSRIDIDYSGTMQTLTGRMGTGGGSVPMVMNERQHALTVCENVANTLTGTDYKGTQCIFEPQEGAKPKVYGICSQNSNSMRSDNPNSGIYEADTSRTIDGNGGNPTCAQGGMAIVENAVCIQGNMIGRTDKNGPCGKGIANEVAYTINTIDRHGVFFESGFAGYGEGTCGTLRSKSGTLGGGSESLVSSTNTVRRLTPLECSRLQGFPDFWCAGLETPNPTDAEIEWWRGVFETYREIMEEETKPKTRKQIIKWLKKPYSDGAAYKMWGNGVALPCVSYIMAGIACVFKDT